MSTQTPTKIHDSNTCTVDNGQPCDMCQRANEIEAQREESCCDYHRNGGFPYTPCKCVHGVSMSGPCASCFIEAGMPISYLSDEDRDELEFAEFQAYSSERGEGHLALTAPVSDKDRTAVTIVKCPCGDAVCNTYGLSDGMFHQGTGWPKERAQEYADAVNRYDARKKRTTEQAPPQSRIADKDRINKEWIAACELAVDECPSLPVAFLEATVVHYETVLRLLHQLHTQAEQQHCPVVACVEGLSNVSHLRQVLHTTKKAKSTQTILLELMFCGQRLIDESSLRLTSNSFYHIPDTPTPQQFAVLKYLIENKTQRAIIYGSIFLKKL